MDNHQKLISIGIYGAFHSASQNNKYLLAWVPGSGQIVLLEGENIILNFKLNQPYDGKVSNNGNFVISDNAIFYGFDLNGNKLIKHNFQSNIYSCGISPDGDFAICQTFNSDNEDCNVLCFFDLIHDELLWKMGSETEWTNSYFIDEKEKLIRLTYEDGRQYKYNFNGEFLDFELLNKERIKNANEFELYDIAREKLNNINNVLTEDNSKEILVLLNRALAKNRPQYSNQKATIHRLIGEVYEKLRNFKYAINHYEEALNLNPKIGLKKKLEKLKETLR
jgi:tetratricopeptide (TPR) repeat protein